jgi:fibronectin-binding autotransporter adhesin
MRNHSLSLRKKLALTALIAGAFALPRETYAAPVTWTGAGVDWATGTNWSTNPNPPVTGDSLIFDAPGAGGLTLNNNLAAGFNVAGMTFNAAAGAYVFNGNSFNLTGGVTNSSTSLQTINNAISLAATQTFTTTGNITLGGVVSGATFGISKAGAGTLTLSAANTFTGAVAITAGAITVTNATGLGTTAGGVTVTSGAALQLSTVAVGAEALTLNGTGISSGGALRNLAGTSSYAGAITLGSASRINSDAGTMTLSGAMSGAFGLTVGGAGNTTISGVIGTGAGTLTKNDAGTLTLSAANTFTGAVTISAGAVTVTNATGLGTTAGGVSVTSGAALQLSTVVVGAEALTLNGTGISSGGALRNLAGTSSYAGAITLGSATRISSDAGTMTLSGAMGGAFGLTVAGAGNTTISGVIGTGAGTLTKLGAGTLTLSGANTYTGSTTISAGAVTVSNAAGLGTTAGGVSVTSGAALQLSTVAVGAEALTLNGTGISAGGALRNLAGTSSYAGAITLGSASRINTDAGTMTLSGTLGGAFGLTVGGASNTVITGDIAAAVTSLTKDGTGVLTLSGINAYGGTSDVTNGVLSFSTTLAIPGYSTSPATAFGATFATPRLTAAAGTTIALPYGASTNAVTTTDIANFMNGTYGGLAVGSSLGIDTTNASPINPTPNTAILTTVITDTTLGQLGFTKTGTNALTVNSANTYTGPTLIANGTLNASVLGNVATPGPSSLGAQTTASLGTVSLGAGAATGTLSYTGVGPTSTDRVFNLAGTTGGGGIDNASNGLLTISSAFTFTGAGAKTLTVSGASDTTFAAPLVGGVNGSAAPLTLAKTGTGTLLLGATGPINTNTVATLSVSGGIVDIGSSGLTIANLGGTVISSSANATINGTGGGVLTISSIAANGGGDIRPAAGTTLTINANVSTPVTNTGFWTGQGGALELNDAGTLVLTGNNTVGGNTIITAAGTISVGSFATNLGGTTGLIMNTAGSRFLYTGSSETVALPISTGTNVSGTLDMSGTGTLNFSGAWTTGAAAKTITLQGSTAGVGIVSGIITDNSATNTTAITKAGTGTWTLSGTNTYTGLTTVNGGNLRLTTGTTNTSAVTVHNGGTLSVLGNYTIGNATTAAKGGSLTLAAGGVLDLADGAINTLTLTQNTTFATAGAAFNGGTIKLDVSGAAADSIFNSGGTVGSTSSGLNAIVINPIAGFAAGGPYTIISGGAGSGSISNANFFLASSNINVGGTPYTLALSQSGTNELLTITPGVSLTAPGAVYWNGTTTSSWSTQPGGAGTATNWVAGASGAPDSFSLPGATSNVFMTSNTVGVGGLTTTIDGVSSINSLNFTGTGTSNTAGSTINAGSGTSLTINATAANGNVAGSGITVAAGSGANTINVPVVLGANQAWTNNSTNNLTVASGISGTGFGLTVAGSGTVVLGASNSFDGPLSIGTGATNGTASVSALAALGTNAVVNLGGTTATGTLLYTGTGETLTKTVTLNGTAGGGTIDQSGTGALTINNFDASTGNGIHTLTLQGSTAGTGNFAATLDNNGTTISTTAPAAPAGNTTSLTVTDSTGMAVGMTISGIDIQPNTTITAIAGNVLTLSQVTVNSKVGIAGQSIVASYPTNLTKAGSDAWTFSGTGTSNGSNILVTGGTLNLTGTYGNYTSSAVNNIAGLLTLQPTSASVPSIINVSGGLVGSGIRGANIAGGTSVYNQTAGTVVTINGTNSAGNFVVASVAGAYGMFNLTGGTYRVGIPGATSNVSGGRFNTNQGSMTTGFASAVAYVGGGANPALIDNTFGEWFINGYSHGQITVLNNGTIDHTGSSNPLALFMDTAQTGGAYGVFNIAGGSIVTGAQPIQLGNSTTNGSGNIGIINLASGTLSTGVNMGQSLNAAGANRLFMNYTGGTLKATGTLTQLVPTSNNAVTATQTMFGSVDNSAVAGAPSFAGGLTIDTNGNPVTIPAATPLLAATGTGVTQANLTVTGGSGYVGAPEVIFSNPSSPTGVPASGYALMSGGSVQGIVITSPGVYAAGETPTITLSGGGASVVATVTTSALNSANVSGGLTKIGLGTLTLSAANTYTGGTTVTGGTLALGANNTLANTGNVTVNGGTFDLVTFANTVGTVNLDSGIITGSTGVLTSNNIQLRSGTASGILSGSGTVTKTTTGTVTLSGANTFTVPIDVNNGTVAFATSPATNGPLGNNANVNLSGGAISYTGSATNALNKVVAVGLSNGTVNVANSLGVLTIDSATSSGGTLIKTGPGAAQISGTTILNAGAAGVSVNDGTLQASFGTNGVNKITVGSTGNLKLFNTAADVLTLGTTPGALTLAGGARLGFDLGATTISDTLIVGAGGTAVTSGTITLDFTNIAGFGAGTYNLLQAPSGLSGATYTLGIAPNGFNYTINTTDTLVSLITTAYIPRFWNGSQGGSWSTVNAGPLSNFSTLADGSDNTGVVPGAAHTVIFSASTAPFTSGSVIATTLDGAIAIDSVQFTAAPAGITGVTVAAGAGGTLALTPASTSGGILVNADAGAITISAPLTVGAGQTWNVDGTGTNGSSLDITGNTVFNGAVNKTGAGTVKLSGNNSGSAAITLSAGTLGINSSTALGTGTLSIAAGATIDNSSISGLTLSTNNLQNWNGSFAFTGTQNLNLGTGAVTLGSSLDLTASANTLTVGGNIGDGGNNRSLSKSGAGTVVLGGNNTYTGSTTVTAGTLTANGTSATSGVFVSGGTFNFGNVGALGAGTLTLNSGTIDNMTGASVSVANPIAINGDFAFTGSNNLTLNGSTTTAAITPTITVTGNTLALNSALTGIVGITKAGAGTLTLGGNSAYNGTTTSTGGTLNINGAITGNGAKVFSNTTVNLSGSFTGTGNTMVNLGTLNLTGSLTGNSTTTTLAYGTTAGNTIVNHSGTFNGFVLTGANVPGSNAIFNQTAGSVTIVPPNSADSQFLANNGGYGMLNLTGGTFTTARFDGVGATGTAATTAVIYVGGTGTLNQNVGDWFLPIRQNGIMSMTVAPGGTFVRQAATTAQFSIIGLNGTNTYGILNVAGGTVDTGAGGTGKGISIGGSGFSPGTGNVALVNAAGGTLILGANGSLGGAGGTTSAFYNFAGATVKASAAMTTVIPASTANYTLTSTVFGPITNNNNANIAFNTQVGVTSNFIGGLTVDTNGFAVGFTNALVAATGTGVTQGNIGDLSLLAGNTGYIGAPMVQFAAPAAGGDPASGYAVISGGQVTGIVITNPGVYASGETPLITLTGGGGSIAAFNATAVTTANTSGGLTKISAGTLSLSGANTYTGPTTITGGTLQLGAGGTTGTLSLSSTIVNNGVFAVNRTNATVQGVDFTATDIAGTGSLLQAGTGTTALTTNNTYLGGTTITAGVLDLGNGGTTGFFGPGPVTLTAGALSFNRTNTVTLGATNLVAGAGAVNLINSGTVVASVDNQFNTTGALVFGTTASTTTSTLNLSSGSSTFGAGSVLTNSTTANSIVLAAGKTLTLNGGLSVGYAATAGSATDTRLTVTGGGTVAVNGTNLVVGVDISTQNAAWFNKAVLNVTAVSNFTTNVTNFNIGVGSLSAPSGSVLLSNTANTILATTLTVGNTGGNNGNGANFLTLGTGTNVIQADTIQIGRGKGSGAGTISFVSQATGSPGTVTIANKLGTGAAAIDIANDNTTVTSGAATGTLDLRGHNATVNASTVTMGNLNMASSTGSTTGTLSFDTGTFTVATLNMAPKTALGTGTANATVNIGGGAFNVNTGFTLGSQATAGASVATVNITGGVVTSNVDILDGGGVTTSTITLNGGTLNMTGKNIGSATAIDNLNFRSGTLSNVNEINNGANLVKTTAGVLNMTGTSNYTGQTLVNEGVLTFNTIDNVGAVTGTALGKPATAVAGTIGLGSTTLGGTLRYVGTATASTDRVVDLAGTTGNGGLDASGTGTITYTSNLTASGVGSKSLVLSGSNTGNNTVAGLIPDNGGANLTSVVKNGPGTWVLSAANAYTGSTTLNGGTLSVSSLADGGLPSNIGSSSNAASNLVFANNAVLNYTGTTTSTDRNYTLNAGGGTFQINNAAATLNITGAGQGAGGITKTGPGTLNLTAASTFSGASAVNAGTLRVNNTVGSGLGTSNVTVNTGATIGGAGSFTGSLIVANGGTVSPGNSPGIMGAGNTTWSTGGNYNWQMLDATGTAGTGFDQLAITGTLNVAAGFKFNLWSLSSTGPDVNGNALNFNNSLTQFWVVATTTAGGFTAGDLGGVNIVTAAANGTGGFANGLGGGSFSLIPGGGVAPGTANDVVLKFSTAVAGSPDLSVTSVAPSDLFVLRNASLATATSLVTLTNGNANTGTVSGFTTSNPTTLTATTGQSIPASPGTINSTISLLSTGTNTTALGATVTYNTTPADGNPLNNDATVNVRIGNAPLHATASSTSYGAALIAATPISVTPYTDLSSNTIGQVSTGSTVPTLGTTATIFNYTNSTGTDTGINMAWRSRTAAEASSTVPGDNGTLVAGYLVSDVVNLTGMGNTGGTGFTDTFILQMSYNEALLDGFESFGVTEGNIVIAWKNGIEWVNAVNGNSTPGGTYFANQAYNAASRSLGDYGIDPTNNVVWAVLNHNSEFAVIPEPSTLVLGGLALLGFAGVGLRRRRIAK